jgi:hypothetical protein
MALLSIGLNVFLVKATSNSWDISSIVMVFNHCPRKWHVIKNFKLPGTIKDLQRSLGMVNYYRRFIPHAAEAQLKLQNILSGKNKKTGAKILSVNLLPMFNIFQERPILLQTRSPEFKRFLSLNLSVTKQWRKLKKKMRSPRALYSDKAPNWALGTINKCRQFRNISRYNSRWRQYLPA